jgi:hypothetical protein
VNLSLDNGASWRNFRHEDGREETLSGNFVPALGAQRTSGGVSRIWAATWVVSSDGDEFYGVSVSEDDGSTWRRVLGSPEEPVRAHNFAFDDSIAYVASDQGFYKSVDGGRSWGRFPSPRDDVSGERFYGEEVFSAATGPELLFLGGPEGLALSANGGLDWSIARSYPPPGGVNPETGAQVPSAYAYPNPFSPSRFPAVRFQYEMKRPGTVTLEVYDFAMELVVRPVKDKPRGEGTWNEVWDGYRADGESVANGVYFFRLTGGGQERWGKVLVLD